MPCARPERGRNLPAAPCRGEAGTAYRRQYAARFFRIRSFRPALRCKAVKMPRGTGSALGGARMVRCRTDD